MEVVMAERREADVPVDADGVQSRSTLSADGRFEFPDPVPMAPPVDFRPPPSLIDMIRSYVRHELSQVADMNEVDSFEEADDFDVVDEFGVSELDRQTPYEAVFDPPLPAQKDAVDRVTGKRAPEDVASGPGQSGVAASPPAAPTNTPEVKASEPVVKRSEGSS